MGCYELASELMPLDIWPARDKRFETALVGLNMIDCGTHGK